MATQKSQLKTYFQTGKKPTQSQFAQLIDAFRHVDEPLTVHNIDGLYTDLSGKQNAQDFTLQTADKTVAGAINELKIATDRLPDLERRTDALENAPEPTSVEQFTDVVHLVSHAITEQALPPCTQEDTNAHRIYIVGQISNSLTKKAMIARWLSSDENEGNSGNFWREMRSLDGDTYAIYYANAYKIVKFSADANAFVDVTQGRFFIQEAGKFVTYNGGSWQEEPTQLDRTKFYRTDDTIYAPDADGKLAFVQRLKPRIFNVEGATGGSAPINPQYVPLSADVINIIIDDFGPWDTDTQIIPCGGQFLEENRQITVLISDAVPYGATQYASFYSTNDNIRITGGIQLKTGVHRFQKINGELYIF